MPFRKFGTERTRDEHSEELRNLALRFFSFDEEYRSERTLKYMEWAMVLKSQAEHLEEMLDIMRGCSGFDRLAPQEYPEKYTNYTNSDVAKDIRLGLNQYSSETLFQTLKVKAVRAAQWKSDHGFVPNAEASAWLSYFCDWGPKEPAQCGHGYKGDFVPNKNWHSFYKENFASHSKTVKKVKKQKKA